MLPGTVTALAAGLLPIRELAELVNIGTLSAFMVICTSVLILRIQQPDLACRFRTPMLWLLAPFGIVFSRFLIIGWPWFTNGHFHIIGGLDIVTIWRFVLWMAIGFVIYFSDGMRHSELAAKVKAND